MQARFRSFIGFVFILLMLPVAALSFSLPGLSKHQKVTPSGNAVTIPVASVSDGKAHYFKLAEGGKEIVFFVAKGRDGQFHTAFDACDACYREKKGYEQKGEIMVCRNCNMKFPINRIGAKSVGGCNPSYLPHTVTGSSIQFSLADIRQGARFF